MERHRFLKEVGSMPNLTWQQRLSMVSKEFNVNASQAAQMLDPYYRSEEDLQLVVAYLEHPKLSLFLSQMATLVQMDKVKWSEAVGHVATELNIPADKAAVLLSEFVKRLY